MRKEKFLIIVLMLVFTSIGVFAQRSKTFTGVNIVEKSVVTTVMGDFLVINEKIDNTIYVQSNKHNIDFSNVGMLTLIFEDGSEAKLASEENVVGINKAMKFPVRGVETQEMLRLRVKSFRLYDRRTGKIHKFKSKDFYLN